jgi:hypothetical protein
MALAGRQVSKGFLSTWCPWAGGTSALKENSIVRVPNGVPDAMQVHGGGSPGVPMWTGRGAQRGRTVSVTLRDSDEC